MKCGIWNLGVIIATSQKLLGKTPRNFPPRRFKILVIHDSLPPFLTTDLIFYSLRPIHHCTLPPKNGRRKTPAIPQHLPPPAQSPEQKERNGEATRVQAPNRAQQDMKSEKGVKKKGTREEQKATVVEKNWLN